VLGLLVIASSAAAQLWSTELRVTETLAHGQVDLVLPRTELRRLLGHLLEMYP